MEEKKRGFFGRLVDGLAKTRDNIVSGMDSIFSGFSAIDEDFYEELEEILIMGDLGIQTTMSIMEDLRRRVKEEHIKEPAQCRQIRSWGFRYRRWVKGRRLTISRSLIPGILWKRCLR